MATTEPTMQKKDFRFADERTKIAWEVGQKVSRIANLLPAENPNSSASKISFDSKYKTRGTYAIFMAGTVVGTEHLGVFMVPQRTLIILKKLGIPYRNLKR